MCQFAAASQDLQAENKFPSSCSVFGINAALNNIPEDQSRSKLVPKILLFTKQDTAVCPYQEFIKICLKKTAPSEMSWSQADLVFCPKYLAADGCMM